MTGPRSPIGAQLPPAQRPLHAKLAELRRKFIRTYSDDSGRLREDYGAEQNILAGGYAYRQVLELVQNAADAILEGADQGTPRNDVSRIEVRLTETHLYTANTGAPLSLEGLETLLRVNDSRKRASQIGRFGLGFKSLLGLGGQIDVFSRTGGDIRFDPERCRRGLSRLFRVSDVPGMRLAWPLDDAERQRDPVMAEFDWAETVIRAEVLDSEIHKKVESEIKGFPEESLLFFPASAALRLDVVGVVDRQLRVSVNGERYTLHDGDESSDWMVVGTTARISDHEALQDATHVHARDGAAIRWALPIGARREAAGLFWAFFPTGTRSHVPGILNAPWKLNSDRTSVIEGKWNAALMEEAAKLIAQTLPSLATPDDPGRPLDAFPRQVERSDSRARPLLESLWQRLCDSAVVADGTGVLRQGIEMLRHPTSSSELAETWHRLASTQARLRFVHPSCLKDQRESRLKALAERLSTHSEESAALQPASVGAWFAEIASAETGIARSVIRLAESVLSDLSFWQVDAVRSSLRIIPTSDGSLATPQTALLGAEDMRIPGFSTVSPSIQEDAESRRILIEVLEVQQPDEDAWRTHLETLISKSPSLQGPTLEAAWLEIWEVIRAAPLPALQESVKRERSSFRVRRRDGAWVPPDEVLLPGRLVAEGSVENAGLLVDLNLHGEDHSLLAVIGVSDSPTGVDWVTDFEPFRRWIEECRNLYLRTEPRARRSSLSPDMFHMPNGYRLLPFLKGEAAAHLTTDLINRFCGTLLARNQKFGRTRSASRAPIEVLHPIYFWLRQYGQVAAGGTTFPLAALAIRQDTRTLQSLEAFRSFAELANDARDYLAASTSASAHLKSLWQGALAELSPPLRLDSAEMSGLLNAAAADGYVPSELRYQDGVKQLQQIAITESHIQAQRAANLGVAAVALNSDALTLWKGRGALLLEGQVRISWESEVSPAAPIVEAFPELAGALDRLQGHNHLARIVSGLVATTADTARPIPCAIVDGILHADADALARLSRFERVSSLVGELISNGWVETDRLAAVEQALQAELGQRKLAVRAASTLAGRLWLAVGRRSEPLLAALGPGGEEPEIQSLPGEELAELLLAQLGPSTLYALRDAFEEQGLAPPARWVGPAAAEFAGSIGFPAEYGATAARKRDPEEIAWAPFPLPPLHDYQTEVFESLGRLFASDSPRRRAVVSLPTGAGKTRVMVESAVRHVLGKKEAPNRLVLWVAQTDEICEQAVQAFRQAWSNFGAPGEPIRIIRLWGGNPNPSQREEVVATVVIASIQTLNARFRNPELDWLRAPALAVVDECHHAIAPSYSDFLRWIGAAMSRGVKDDDPSEPILIGLSATPFRADDDESRRLASRFGRVWYPAEQEGLYHSLQSSGILARSSYESLDSGASLSEGELARLDTLDLSSGSIHVERFIEELNQRLGKDADRSQRIVDFVAVQPQRSILLFANSVDHAHALACRLHLRGIPSAAISAQSSVSARRHFLQRFQSGEIRVLCNHSVLSTGFDAPRTDMVLIARQVFSPTRYMQMVGRGLRGPRNGGTASCRIVTVMDNLGRFAARHPYHYCRGLYSAED